MKESDYYRERNSVYEVAIVGKGVNFIKKIKFTQKVQLSGFSGTGKSTIMLSIIMGLAEVGEKTLIVSNEQESKYFKDMMCAFVCNWVFNCYTISRKKIANRSLNDDEKEVLLRANKFIRDKFEDKILFLPVSDFDLPKIFKYAKRLKIMGKCSAILLDTLKPDSESLGSMSESALNMVKMTRELDKFCRQEDMIPMCTSQLQTGQEGILTMTASCLSQSKQTKEVAGVLLLWRKVYTNVELDKDNDKFFLKPYIWEYDTISKKSSKRYLTITNESKCNPWDKYTCDISGSYLICSINKNRFGQGDLNILYQTDLRTGRLYEKGFVEHISNSRINQ